MFKCLKIQFFVCLNTQKKHLNTWWKADYQKVLCTRGPLTNMFYC